MRKEYRCQENKDAVARLTLERLSNTTPEQLKEMADNEEKGSAHNVDDDWLNTFERYAEDASSDKMRNLWAKVLSGEIRKPRSYSLRTIRFLSELEAEIASIFERISAEIVSNRFIPSINGRLGGERFEIISALQNAGLIYGFGQETVAQLSVKTDAPLYITNQGRPFFVYSSIERTIEIDALFLTETGKQITSLIEQEFNETMFDQVVSTISARVSASKIQVVDPDGQLRNWKPPHQR